MAPSTVRRVARIGAGAPAWLAALTLLLAGLALALAALSSPAARADAPALSITVDSDPTHIGAGACPSTKCAIFVVHATAFPPNVPFTLTSSISADTSAYKTHADGSFAWSYIMDVTGTKYCGSVQADAGGASATVNFWVTDPSDSDIGKTCAPGSSSGVTSTPTVDATAAAAASATAAAAPTATTAPAAPSTDNSSPPSTGLRARLAKLPLGLIGGGMAVLFIVIVIVVAMSRRSGDDMGGYSSPGARGGTAYRQGPPRQGPPRGPDRGGSSYGRR
jgi:hypothetical protein